MRYTIIHARDICVTNMKPIPDVGRSINDRTRSVTCTACGRAGVTPRPDHVEAYIDAWAARNGYNFTKVGDQYRVELAPRRRSRT